MRATTVLAACRCHPLLGLLLAALSAFAHAEPAGRVIFAIGDGVAIDSRGSERPLQKGAQVEEGDTLVTNNGRAQIQFKDRGFVALQPHTRFLVERYRYTAAGDAEDGVIMALIKGGLRTISGLVGKRDRSAYSMKTAVATIGIRGTDYALELGDKLVGNVADGAIEVCNGAGCVNVLKGQAFLVPSLIELPVLGDRHVFLPPAAPQKRDARTDPTTAAGQDDEQGSRQALAGKADAAPSPADQAVGALDSSSLGTAPSVGVGVGTASTLPPGQAKKLDAVDSLTVLPAPATLSGPPGQIKKLDAGALDGATLNPGKGAGPPGGIPPGQVKR